MNIQQLRYLSSLLHGKRELTEAEAVARAGRLGLVRLTPPFLVAEVAPYYFGVRPEDKDDLIQACADEVRRFLERRGFSLYYYVNEFDNVQVIFTAVAPGQDREIETAFIDLRDRLQLRFELDSFVGMGAGADAVTGIATSARDAAEMLAYKYTYAEQGVVNIKNLIRFAHSPNYASDIRFDRVIGCFQDGNIGKLARRLGELVEEVRSKPNASGTSIRRTFIELTVSVLHAAANADVDTEAVIGGLDIYQWILDQQHTEALTEWFIRLCEELHTRMQDQQESTEQSIVQSACAYIEGHIDRQDLGLNAVSDAVGLSPCYFSKLFKREKGIGLSNYISMARIEQARRLLETTELSLADIARQTGFSSAPYFSQVFKKTTGDTPGEHRRTAKLRKNG